MARPAKTGLDYFPLDVGFFKDKRIRRLISRFGADGAAFYLYVLCEAYLYGYSVDYNDDFVEDAALDLGCSTEKIGLMLHYLLNKSLLDSTLFNTVKVLSSHAIQSQYQTIKKSLKRDVEVNGDSWILDESETEGFIKVRHIQCKSGKNPDKSGINHSKSGIYPQRKEKERKENKSKGKDYPPAGESSSPSAPGAAISFFLDRIYPTPPQHVLELLADFERDLGPEVCIRAMTVALDSGKGRWDYIHGILKNKRRDGVRSLAAWDALEAEREKRKGKSNGRDTTEDPPPEYRVGKWL